jgi:hypothetical protein
MVCDQVMDLLKRIVDRIFLPILTYKKRGIMFNIKKGDLLSRYRDILIMLKNQEALLPRRG